MHKYNHLKKVYNRDLPNYFTYKPTDNNMNIDTPSSSFSFFSSSSSSSKSSSQTNASNPISTKTSSAPPP
jgi:hypothetical protein